MADPIYTPDDPGTSIDDTIAFDEIIPLPENYIEHEELNSYVGRISPVLTRMLARLKRHDGSWIPEGWQMDSRPGGEPGFSVVGGKEFEFTVNYWDADAETAHTGVLPGEGRAVIIQLLTNKDDYSEKFYFVLGHFTASGAPTLAESAESRADSGSYVYIDLPDPTAEVGVVTDTVGFLTGTQITPHFQVPELTILLDTGSGEVPAGTVQTVLPTYSAKYVNGQKFLDVAASFVLEGVETEAVSGEFFVDVAHLPVDTSGDSVGSLTWNCVGFAGADVAANFVGAESRVYLAELDQGTGDWTPIVATVDTSTEDIVGELRVRVPLVGFPVLANTELTDFLTFMNAGTAEEFRLGLAAGSAGGKFPLHPSCFGSGSSFSFLHSAKVEEFAPPVPPAPPAPDLKYLAPIGDPWVFPDDLDAMGAGVEFEGDLFFPIRLRLLGPTQQFQFVVLKFDGVGWSSAGIVSDTASVLGGFGDLCVHAGQLYALPTQAGILKVWDGTTTWTAAATAAETSNGLISYNGNLYSVGGVFYATDTGLLHVLSGGAWNAVSAPLIIEGDEVAVTTPLVFEGALYGIASGYLVMSTGGSWSVVTSNSIFLPGETARVTDLTIYDNTLYAITYDYGTSTNAGRIAHFSGSSWVYDADVIPALYVVQPRGLLEYENLLYALSGSASQAVVAYDPATWAPSLTTQASPIYLARAIVTTTGDFRVAGTLQGSGSNVDLYLHGMQSVPFIPGPAGTATITVGEFSGLLYGWLSAALLGSDIGSVEPAEISGFPIGAIAISPSQGQVVVYILDATLNINSLWKVDLSGVGELLTDSAGFDSMGGYSIWTWDGIDFPAGASTWPASSTQTATFYQYSNT